MSTADVARGQGRAARLGVPSSRTTAGPAGYMSLGHSAPYCGQFVARLSSAMVLGGGQTLRKRHAMDHNYLFGRAHGSERLGLSEQLGRPRPCRRIALRRTAACARHMLPHVPPRCAADEQEWQEMAQEHLFARAEQSVCSAPYAGVSQVPRYLLDISDCFILVARR